MPERQAALGLAGVRGCELDSAVCCLPKRVGQSQQGCIGAFQQFQFELQQDVFQRRARHMNAALIECDFDARARVWREARDLVYNIINCPKPIVSAMQGAVAGGGLSIGLLADISIATKSAKLVDAHTRLGVCAGDHAVMLWPLLCGLARAKHLLLLCEPISGEKAADIGLVSMCVDDDELDSTALRIATQLAKGAPLAIQTTKYALNNWLRMAGPAFDASTALQFFSFGGPEPKEGLTAHQQKRPPSF